MDHAAGAADAFAATQDTEAVPVPAQHVYFVGTYAMYIAAALFVAAVLGGVAMLTGDASAARYDWRYHSHGERSYDTCQQAIIDELREPQTASFPTWDGEDVDGRRLLVDGDVVTTRIRSHVVAEDAAGNMVQEAWTCRAEDSSGTSWVVDLDLGGEGTAESILTR